jgi:acyl-CoA synthetase (AMP-forming)/AMP-acid ligase II
MVETLIESLAATVARVPDKTAFRFEGASTDFATFARRTDRVAAALHAAGIAPGERIAYIGKNSAVFFEAMYGAMKAGAVMVPVNWRLAGPEISVIVDDAQARLILVGPEFNDLVAAELALPNGATRHPRRQRPTPPPPTISPCSSTPPAQPAGRRA